MNFTGYTTSNMFQVKDGQAFEDALKRFRFGADLACRHVDVPTPNVYEISGEDTFCAFAPETDVDEDLAGPDYSTDLSIEFTDMLREHLADGQRIVMQSIGHEGTRFPFVASAIIITPDKPVQTIDLPVE